jgi:hypothetical protein
MRISLALGLLGLAALAACGDSGSEALLGGYGRSGDNGIGGGSGSSGGPSVGTATNGNMDGGAASTGSSSGASGSSGSGGTGVIQSDGGLAPDGGGQARALFEALLPAFDSACGNACHQLGGSGAPPYLGGTDPYTTIHTYQGIIAPVAAQSILLTKGQHEGPPLAAALQTSLTGWLTVEAQILAATGPAVTPAATIASGANTIDLSSLGVSGVSLTFSAAISGDILTLSSVALVAPATTAVQVIFPTFFVNTTSGAQTADQDMSNVSQTVPAGTSAALGTGLLVITGWAASDTIQISFQTIAKTTVADAGTSGCKSVATYQADAVPAIQANTCLNCHNTGGSGNAALDMSALALATPDYATACAQALSRINTTTPSQSDIILAPTGGVAAHPYKNASSSFVTMMETWIQAEK